MAESQPAPSRAETIAPIVAGLCIALPNLAFPYPPMVDLPHHEALVAILRHFDDRALFPEGLYVHNFGHSNALFYFLAWALSFVFSVELACKLVVAMTMVAIPLAGARLAAHLGRSRWVALLLVPVATGWLYQWGMIGNLMGLAALLAMLPALDRLAEQPTAKSALGAIGGVFLLYEAHELMLVLYAGAALIFAAGSPLRPRQTLLRVTPFLVALALNLHEESWWRHHVTPSHARFVMTMAPLGRKFLSLPGTLFGGYEPELLYPLTALVVLCVGLLTAARFRESATSAIRRSLRAFIHGYRFQLLGASIFALYLAMPTNVHGSTMVYHRFLAPAYAILLMCVAPRSPPSRVARLLAVSSPLAALILLLPRFADVSRSASELDKLMPLIRPDSAVAQLDFSVREGARSDAISSTASRVLAARGGRMLFSFVAWPFAPVLMEPAYDWDEPFRRMMYDHAAFCPGHDFTRFRYLLVHTTNARMALNLALALAPEGKFVDTAGDWELFESTLPVVPLLSADMPLPKPHPELLRARLTKIMVGTEAPGPGLPTPSD